MKKNSNTRKIEEYLKENGKINREEAAGVFGCYNLPAVIQTLRGEGLEITQKSRKGKRFADYVLVNKPVEKVVEDKPEEFYAILGFYKSTSGAISVRLDQTLFSSEEEADEYGTVARVNDPEMYAYDIQQMIVLKK